MLHAARCKYRTQKSRQNRHLDTIAQACQAISSQLKHVSTIGKKLVKQQYLLHNWDLLASLGRPCKFQRVSRLGSVTARHSVVGVSQTAALNRGRHLYSAGRPSHWALAHISSCFYFTILSFFTTGHFRCMYGLPTLQGNCRTSPLSQFPATTSR